MKRKIAESASRRRFRARNSRRDVIVATDEHRSVCASNLIYSHERIVRRGEKRARGSRQSCGGVSKTRYASRNRLLSRERDAASHTVPVAHEQLLNEPRWYVTPVTDSPRSANVVPIYPTERHALMKFKFPAAR